MLLSDSGQAGDYTTEVYVTPAMIDAGEGVLQDFVGVADSSELAFRVYTAMRAARESSRDPRKGQIALNNGR